VVSEVVVSKSVDAVDGIPAGAEQQMAVIAG